MSGKKRTTVSLEEGIIEKARAMMEAEDFGDFSGFLEQVIRERWQQRPRAHIMDDSKAPSPAPASARPASPVNYKTRSTDKTRTAKRKFGKG